MFHDLITGYVHNNDILQAIEFSPKERAENQKILIVNPMTNNRKRNHADISKASKKKEVK